MEIPEASSSAMEEDSPSLIDHLDLGAAGHIFNYLDDPMDLARLAAVSRSCHQIVGFEEVGFTGIKMLLDVRQRGLDGIPFGAMARAKPNEAVEKEIWAEKSFNILDTGGAADQAIYEAI